MIKLVIDSTAYATEEFVKKNDIKIVPLTIHCGEQSFVEGMPGTFDEIFNAMEAMDEQCKSSQPSPEIFKKAFDEIIDDGNEVFVITLSSSLSGTFNSARLAASMSQQEKITIFDSQGCGQLTLLYVEEAVRLIEEGLSREEIAARLKILTENSSEVFAPVSLKYLIRGGRIGGVSATIGSLLHVKPLLAFSSGVLACKKKVIGMQKAIKEIVAEIPKAAKNIYVMHISKSVFFEPLFEKVKEAFPNVNIRKGEIGPVIGIHVGPGTIGVAYNC